MAMFESLSVVVTIDTKHHLHILKLLPSSFTSLLNVGYCLLYTVVERDHDNGLLTVDVLSPFPR